MFFCLSEFSSETSIKCTRHKSIWFLWSGRTLLFQKLQAQTSDYIGQQEGREDVNCNSQNKVLSVLD